MARNEAKRMEGKYVTMGQLDTEVDSKSWRLVLLKIEQTLGNLYLNGKNERS